MGLLDSVLGAITGQPEGGNSALLQAAIRMLGNDAPGGGLAALVEQFERSGHGDVINSWIGSGRNLPISPELLHNVLGSDTVGALAQQLGLSPSQAASQLSQLLPQVVDRLTPTGEAPQNGLGNMGELLGRFLQN